MNGSVPLLPAPWSDCMHRAPPTPCPGPDLDPARTALDLRCLGRGPGGPDRLDHWFWWFLMSKFLEYIDTFFLVVRRKHSNSVGWYLQVYHHSTTSMVAWVGWFARTACAWSVAPEAAAPSRGGFLGGRSGSGSLTPAREAPSEPAGTGLRRTRWCTW